MERDLTVFGSRGFWIGGLLFFLLLEGLLSLKVGTIWALALAWVYSLQVLGIRNGLPGHGDVGKRAVHALHAAFFFAAIVFVFFGLLNMFLRSVDQSYIWFALP